MTNHDEPAPKPAHSFSLPSPSFQSAVLIASHLRAICSKSDRDSHGQVFASNARDVSRLHFSFTPDNPIFFEHLGGVHQFGLKALEP